MCCCGMVSDGARLGDCASRDEMIPWKFNEVTRYERRYVVECRHILPLDSRLRHEVFTHKLIGNVTFDLPSAGFSVPRKGTARRFPGWHLRSIESQLAAGGRCKRQRSSLWSSKLGVSVGADVRVIRQRSISTQSGSRHENEGSGGTPDPWRSVIGSSRYTYISGFSFFTRRC